MQIATAVILQSTIFGQKQEQLELIMTCERIYENYLGVEAKDVDQ